MVAARLLVTCEHGGNRIPAPYRALFRDHRALLDSHRGWDPGALLMASELSRAFAAPLVTATVSRLLVDLNRSVGHPRLHSDALPQALRWDVVDRHYRPYREQAERLVRSAAAGHGRVVHISSHTFTPELGGKTRNADVGLLYDPARPGEVELCERWRTSLRACAPGLAVRRNYPYQGKGDGLTSWFRRLLPPGRYVGIELEVNQKHVFRGGRHWALVRAAIIESLRLTLNTGAAR